MTTYNTRNPLGSAAAKDVYDNAENLDKAVNSSDEIWVDRLGTPRRTLVGIDRDANRAMLAYGYITKKSFELGNTISNPNEVLLSESNGEYYRWDGLLPKVVPAGSTPESTGGVASNAWKSVGDATLRGTLASPDQGMGTSIVESHAVGNLESYLEAHNFLTFEQFGVVNDFDLSAGTGTDNREKIQQAIAVASVLGKTLVSASGGNIGFSGEIEVDVKIDLFGARFCQINKAANTVKITKHGQISNGEIFHNMSTGSAVTITGEDGIFIGRNLRETIKNVRIYSSDSVQPVVSWKGRGLVLEAIGTDNHISGISVNAVIQGFEYAYYEHVTGDGFINSNEITLNINLFKHAITIDSSVVGREYSSTNSTYNLNIQPQSGSVTAMSLACANSEFYGALWDGALMNDVSRAVTLINTAPSTPYQSFITCKGNYISMFGINEDRCIGNVTTNTIINPTKNNISKIKQPFSYNYGSEVILRRHQASADGISDTLIYTQSLDNFLFNANLTNLCAITKTNAAGTNLGVLSASSGVIDNIFKYNTSTATFLTTDYVTIMVSLKDVGSFGGLNFGESILDSIGFITNGNIDNAILEVRFSGASTWTKIYESYEKKISRAMSRFNPSSGDTNTVAPANVDGVRFRLQANSGIVEIRELMAMATDKIGHSVLSGSNPQVTEGDLTFMMKGRGLVLCDSQTGTKYRLIVTNGTLNLYSV
ncbi:hypothetical protein F164LOC_10305 [Pectobacterium carotovorum]|nr:hypothetical protein F164LOC_10305 [Pectobacterium carotovorum]